MGFVSEWFQKFWLLVRWKFVQLVDIKPFLEINPNAYCVACGARRGNITTVTDGTNVMVQHVCEICGWAWQEHTVTVIDQTQIVPQMSKEEQEEDLPAEEIARRQTPRFITIPPKGEAGVKVNGQVLVDLHGDYAKKKQVATGK